jgi:hypothetical protein
LIASTNAGDCRGVALPHEAFHKPFAKNAEIRGVRYKVLWAWNAIAAHSSNSRPSNGMRSREGVRPGVARQVYTVGVALRVRVHQRPINKIGTRVRAWRDCDALPVLRIDTFNPEIGHAISLRASIVLVDGYRCVEFGAGTANIDAEKALERTDRTFGAGYAPRSDKHGNRRNPRSAKNHTTPVLFQLSGCTLHVQWREGWPELASRML